MAGIVIVGSVVPGEAAAAGGAVGASPGDEMSFRSCAALNMSQQTGPAQARWITSPIDVIAMDDFVGLSALSLTPQDADQATQSARPDEDTLSAPQPPRFGQEGTWRFQIMAGYGQEFGESSNEFVQAGVSFSYFAADDVSLDLEFNGDYFGQRGDDAVGGNMNLMLRWHIVSRETWSFYLDGGAGILGTTDDVPFNGTEFNFTPQAGFGFTFDINESDRLFVGARWQHISNANTDKDNPGRDSWYLYGGISFPF